jgi:phosphomannomutase
MIDYSFNCSGNEISHYGTLIHRNEWIPFPSLISYLEHLLENSKFEFKTGKHIEQRTGMINFSIVGRNCNMDERSLYALWDRNTSERLHLREKISATFSEIEVFLGGETGLDIYPKGKNKEQVIPFLKDIKTEKLYYFGDQIFRYGNDYNVAMKCDHRYQVRKWQDTHEILNFLKEAGYCS